MFPSEKAWETTASFASKPIFPLPTTWAAARWRLQMLCGFTLHRLNPQQTESQHDWVGRVCAAPCCKVASILFQRQPSTRWCGFVRIPQNKVYPLLFPHWKNPACFHHYFEWKLVCNERNSRWVEMPQILQLHLLEPDSSRHKVMKKTGLPG